MPRLRRDANGRTLGSYRWLADADSSVLPGVAINERRLEARDGQDSVNAAAGVT
jgi:hypothetical protein